MTQTARSQTPHHHFTGDTETNSSGQKTRRARRYCAILLRDVRAALLTYLHHCSALLLLLLPQTRTWPGSGGKNLAQNVRSGARTELCCTFLEFRACVIEPRGCCCCLALVFLLWKMRRFATCPPPLAAPGAPFTAGRAALLLLLLLAFSPRCFCRRGALTRTRLRTHTHARTPRTHNSDFRSGQSK